MIGFKLDEDPLQSRTYFLTFIDSLNMGFSQYRETYEVLRDYPKMEGENIKDYAKSTDRKLNQTRIRHHLICQILHCQTQNIKERNAKIRKSVASIEKMTRDLSTS